MERNLTALALFLLLPMLLLLPFALLLQRGRRRKVRHPARSMRAMTAALSGALALLWFTSMAALTLDGADQRFQRFTAQSAWAPDWAAANCGLEEIYTASSSSTRLRKETLPEELEQQIFAGLAQSTAYPLVEYSRDDWRLGLNEAGAMETSVLFLGPEREILWGDRDVLSFSCASEGEGGIGVTQKQLLHFGWVDLGTAGEKGPFRRLYRILRREGSLQPEIQILRITGVWEGTELVPASLDVLHLGSIQAAAGSLARLEKAGELDWESVFRDETVTGELVTVYGRYPELFSAAKKPLTLRDRDGNAVRFDSLRDYLLADVREETPPLDHRRSLGLCLEQSWRIYRSEDVNSKRDFTLVAAVCYRPLAAAVRSLWPVYLATLVLTLALGFTLLRLLRRRLVDPVTDVAEGMAGDWYPLYTPEASPPVWREAAALRSGYDAEREHRRYGENERLRLEQALDYAREAEEKRRLLISSLAHELKTPLAVLTSYAEGLRAHIAEEKREQYLDTILSESRRMDALVMQMLDLSRLEAGRVKLSRDDFDLRELTEQLLEKLRPLAAERDLTLTLEPGEACKVTADESRVAQAVENLLVNALRYAAPGGSVKVRVEGREKTAVFRVENPVERPFAPEEREKVWEPFYRRDKARSGPGTGLGLSIVRQIVELHGGSCGLRSTEGGVEFSFTLPR